VQDNHFLAAELEAALVEVGHRVIGKAPSFDGALQIVESSVPEVALVDQRLQGPRTALPLRSTYGSSERRSST
jgi:DNA-binding NarL/FixJ family response regulator